VKGGEKGREGKEEEEVRWRGLSKGEVR